MEYNKLISMRIQQLNRERNYSLNYLATRAEVSRSTLDNIVECRIKSPSLITIHSVAIAYDMSIPEFLNFESMSGVTLKDLRRNKPKNNRK